MSSASQERLRRASAGLLVGTAVGDSIGLPLEGLSRKRVERRLRGRDLQHGFWFGWGVTSDDTDHSVFVAQGLLAAGDDPGQLARALANKLRLWILSCPPGIGFATLRSGLKLLIGFPPSYSGVWSAGNGSAMRAAPIGVVAEGDQGRVFRLADAITTLTHTDPKARTGSRAMAWVASRIVESARHGESGPDPREVLRELKFMPPDAGSPALAKSADPTSMETKSAGAREAGAVEARDDWILLVDAMGEALKMEEDVPSFAARIGLERGVSGYVYHSVPVALYGWMRHPRNYREAIREVIMCGGDTDTTAAMTGALVGAQVGVEGIPQEWVSGVIDWPRRVSWLCELGNRLADRDGGTLYYPWFLIPLRHAVVTMGVLIHVAWRLIR